MRIWYEQCLHCIHAAKTMKFTTAYYLLLVYVTVILKPFVPVITDMWDHAFNEVEHVCTVHAVYGEKHAEAETGKAAENQNSKNQSTLNSQEPIPVHVSADEYNNELLVPVIIKIYPGRLSYSLPDLYHSVIAPPPKNC